MLRILYILLLSLTVCLLYWGAYGFSTLGIDDSQIYFVYFRNLAEGRGFVYNFGGERVEGFTSLLWTLLGAGAYAATPAHFTYVLLGINCLLFFGTLLLFYKGMQRLAAGKWPLYALAFLVGYIVLVPGYLDWMLVSLMETGLWSFLLTAAVVVVLYFRPNWQYTSLLSLCVLLLVITRPESMLWGIFLIGLVVICLFLENRKLNFKPISVISGVFASTLLALVAFRLHYFGYPLPNTYYAKMSGNLLQNILEGARYLGLAMIQLPMLWLFLLLSLISLLLIFKKLWEEQKKAATLSTAYRWQLVLAGASCLSFLIPLYTGGDHFGMARMLQPLVPVYFLMIFNIRFWEEVSGYALHPLQPMGASLAVLAVFPLFYFSAEVPLHRVAEDQGPLAGEIYVARVGMEDAQKLNQLFAPLEEKPTVGVSAAGGFAWAYQGATFDLLGLNNTAMAHAKGHREGIKNHASFDLNTLLKMRPPIFHGYSHGSAVVAKFHVRLEDAFHPLTQEGFEERFVNEIFKGVFMDARFTDAYKPVAIRHPRVPGIVYQAYFLEEYLPLLREKGYEIKLLSLSDIRSGFEIPGR